MRQRLGQHFLNNTQAIKKIVAALDIISGDIIIEIGPGRGELTNELASHASNIDLFAIEKDEILASNLEEKLGSKISIIKGDVLQKLPKIVNKLPKKDYKIIGNIPYYLTGKLLRLIGELPNRPKKTVFTVQKEVAERISAVPPKMNLLAAAVQLWASTTIFLSLAPKDFSPPPKVSSSGLILSLKPPIPEKLEEIYYKTIKELFKHPRKIALNNLKGGLGLEKSLLETIFKEIDMPNAARPQNFSVEHIIKLAEKLPVNKKA